MKIIDLNNFKAVLFIDGADIINSYNPTFLTWGYLLRKGYSINKINLLNTITDSLCENVVELHSTGLYLNYKSPFFEEDQFKTAKESFFSFMSKNKVGKNVKYVILLDKSYYRVSTPSGKILTAILVNNKISQIKKYKNEDGLNHIITSTGKIFIPFAFRIVGKLNKISLEECNKYMKKKKENNIELFNYLFKDKIKYNESQNTLLLLEDVD